MKNYLNLFWLVPAIAMLLPLLMLVIMAVAPGGLGSAAADVYERLFFITPVVGVAVLFILLVLLIVHRPLLKQISPVKTLAFALLDVVSPTGFLMLQMVLSGFSR